MKNRVFFFALCLAFLQAAPRLVGQFEIQCSSSCCFTDQLPEQQKIYGFASDLEARSALDLVLRHTGLPANFTILAANVPNAAAVILFDGKEWRRYILYNQQFMLQVKNLTATNWSAISILAHEIAHHLCGHTLDTLGSRPTRELEADKFSGFVLYKMGATLAQAQAAMRKIALDFDTPTHPAKTARLAAITNGWLDARELDKRATTPAKPLSQKTTAKIPAKKSVVKLPAAAISGAKIEQTADLVRVCARVNLSNLQGENCLLTAWFYDEAGKPLRDLNQKYQTRDGEVASSAVVRPVRQQVVGQQVEITLPKSELHLAAVGQRLQVRLGVHVGSEFVGELSEPVFFYFF